MSGVFRYRQSGEIKVIFSSGGRIYFSSQSTYRQATDFHISVRLSRDVLRFISHSISTFNFKNFKRVRRITLTSVGDKSPRVEVQPMGPFADLKLRRNILASDDLFEKACVKPKTKVNRVVVLCLQSFAQLRIFRAHLRIKTLHVIFFRRVKK